MIAMLPDGDARLVDAVDGEDNLRFHLLHDRDEVLGVFLHLPGLEILGTAYFSVNRMREKFVAQNTGEVGGDEGSVLLQ